MWDGVGGPLDYPRLGWDGTGYGTLWRHSRPLCLAQTQYKESQDTYDLPGFKRYFRPRSHPSFRQAGKKVTVQAAITHHKSRVSPESQNAEEPAPRAAPLVEGAAEAGGS